jgi:hypothetical protein
MQTRANQLTQTAKEFVMSFTLFINFAHGGKPAPRISAEDDAKLTSLLKPIKGLTRSV